MEYASFLLDGLYDNMMLCDIIALRAKNDSLFVSCSVDDFGLGLLLHQKQVRRVLLLHIKNISQKY